MFRHFQVEETPKKCRDIIATARSILPDPSFQAFSEDLRKAKEEVMTLESILLQTIKFDLEIDHPYNFLVSYAKCLKGDKAKIQSMVQMAWSFVNDSLSTTVCLQWEPEIVAVAVIHLASKLSKFSATDWVGRQPNHSKWWDMFIQHNDVLPILEDVCHQVLDLYTTQSNQSQSIASGASTSSALMTTATPPPPPPPPLPQPCTAKSKVAAVTNSVSPAQHRPKPKELTIQDNCNMMIHENGYAVSEFTKMNRSSYATTCSAPPPPPPPPLMQPYTGTGSQPPSIYPMNVYPQPHPSNVPYNVPQCAQQPPHNIYYNQPISRISGAYYPGP